jgi:hypothetical protein
LTKRPLKPVTGLVRMTGLGGGENCTGWTEDVKAH